MTSVPVANGKEVCVKLKRNKNVTHTGSHTRGGGKRKRKKMSNRATTFSTFCPLGFFFSSLRFFCSSATENRSGMLQQQAAPANPHSHTHARTHNTRRRPRQVNELTDERTNGKNVQLSSRPPKKTLTHGAHRFRKLSTGVNPAATTFLFPGDGGHRRRTHGR